VFIARKDEEWDEVFKTEINSDNKYNSWFYVDFENKVFVPKGTKCVVEVRSANVFQLIPFAHIKENIDKAAECGAFAEFDCKLFEREHRRAKESTEKSLEKDIEGFFCIKSLTVVPVDDRGCLNMK